MGVAGEAGAVEPPLTRPTDGLGLAAFDGQHATKPLFVELERKGIVPKGK